MAGGAGGISSLIPRDEEKRQAADPLTGLLGIFAHLLIFFVACNCLMKE